MATPTLTFEEVELSRYYTEMASGGPTFQVSAIGNRYGIHQRNLASTTPVHKWTIGFEGKEPTNLEVLRTFFMSKFGGAIGFRFYPPSDRAWAMDHIGTGTGAQTVFPLYRKYVGGTQTATRRILKPSDENLSVYYNDVLQAFTRGVHYLINTATGTISFPTPPGNGVTIKLSGGEFVVPVVFDVSTFESEDLATFSNWSGVGLVELLAANLGLT